MASAKILKQKEQTINEIADKIKNSESVVIFTYQGLTVSDLNSLRTELGKVNGSVKVYKNTLTKRALDSLNINMDEFLEGPNAIMFGENIIECIKALTKFAKEKDAVNIRAGLVSGEVVNIDTISEYASIPSLEGLLSMFAGGLMEHVRNFAIGLDLYAKKIEEEK